MSTVNEDVKKRFDHWKYRTVEELYDYENDPHALNNLINDPKYKEVVVELRKQLHQHMKATNDYVLAAFEKKDNTTFLDSWMKKEIKEANKRQRTIKWKRGKNQQGGTKKNTELYDNSTQK